MSMISAQIDGLRELAGDGSVEWVNGPIRASVFRDAADTIWELRDDLQRANDAVRDAEHDESMAWDRVRKAEAEANKLRGQLQRTWDAFHDATAREFVTVKNELRELEIEVDG